MAKSDSKPNQDGSPSETSEKEKQLFHRNTLEGDQDLKFLVDNRFIHTGYRANMGVWGTIKSLFQMHNETMNVWTHLAGAIVFLGLLAHVAVNHAQPLSAWSAAPAAASAPHFPEAAVLRGLSQPLVVAGRHTPRMALLAFAPQRQREGMHEAHRTVAASRGLLDAVSRALPALGDETTTTTTTTNNEQDDRNGDVGASEGVASSVASAVAHLRSALDSYASALSSGSASALSAAQTHLRAAQGVLAAVPLPSPHALGGARSAALSLAAEVAGLAGRLEAVTGTGVGRVSALSRALFESEDELDADALLTAARPEPSAHMPRWPMYVFIASAITCFMSSALFHLLYVMNATAAVFWQRVDLAGISFLIAGSTVPICYYGLFCSPRAAAVHIAFTVLVNSVGLALVLLPRFAGVEYAKFRAITFIIAGVSGVGSISYISATYGLDHPMLWTWLPYTVIQGAIYISGTFFYASQWPESRFPGKFDLFLSSHQIWHLFVLTAAVMHYIGVIELFVWRRHHMCSAEP